MISIIVPDRKFVADPLILATLISSHTAILRRRRMRSEMARAPSEANNIIYRLFADRIRVANAAKPIFEQAGADAPHLYWYWQKGRGQKEVEESLRALFDAEPARVDDFLETYIGEGWELESGPPVRSALQRENYNSISLLISPNYIANNLRSRYGAELDDPQHHIGRTPSQTTNHQFVFTHQRAFAEQQQQPPLEFDSGNLPAPGPNDSLDSKFGCN